jgi:DNA-binding transcriptional MerR regulator
VSTTDLELPTADVADVADVADADVTDVADVAALPAPADDVCLSPDIIATDIIDRALRYYERIGLLDVPRDRAGRRRYTEAEVGRVVFVTRLRLTAMPIRDIQAYFHLVAEGPHTEPQRLELLQRHRAAVVARLADLQSALSVVDFKIALYGG